MNENKIAFIICANNEELLTEAVFYIDTLYVPEGIMVEKIIVRGARSMTAGYNSGMNRSNAKYKVYLHQDTFIANRNLIDDLLRIFRGNPSLGILGVVGATKHVLSGNYLSAWDCGALSSMMPLIRIKDFGDESDYIEGVALDGCFLATQYDLPWREDIFDGWDMYDVSQCFEFIRAGYGVGIARQKSEHPWCHHDTEAMSLGDYFKYRKIMADEYADIYRFEIDKEVKEESETLANHELMDELCDAVCRMIDIDGMVQSAMDVVFQHRLSIRGQAVLCNLKKASIINHEEIANGGDAYFVNDSDTVESITRRLRELRYAIKRLEYRNDISDMVRVLTDGEYSYLAIALCSIFYVYGWDDYLRSLANIFLDMDSRGEFMILQEIIQKYHSALFADGASGVY